eukprot:scaffold69951_cov19-Tisochrysis_lutea.AAC.1
MSYTLLACPVCMTRSCDAHSRRNTSKSLGGTFNMSDAQICPYDVHARQVGREGKGYIAAPACGCSLAEAKHACNQTSPN